MSAEIVYSLNKIVHSSNETAYKLNQSAHLINEIAFSSNETCYPELRMCPNSGKMSRYKYTPNLTVHIGNLAEGEPFQLLFRFRRRPNYGGGGIWHDIPCCVVVSVSNSGEGPLSAVVAPLWELEDDSTEGRSEESGAAKQKSRILQ